MNPLKEIRDRLESLVDFYDHYAPHNQRGVSNRQKDNAALIQLDTIMEEYVLVRRSTIEDIKAKNPSGGRYANARMWEALHKAMEEE